MIKPEQAARFNDEDDLAILAAAEKSIDATLKKSYHTNGLVQFTNSNIPLGKNPRLQRTLFEKYRVAGWKIQSGSDQRNDDSWVIFKSEAKHGSPIPGCLR